LLEAELALAGGMVFFQYLGADDIGRHQVGRELHAMEVHIRGLRQRFHQQRLAQSRHTFHQCVAAGQQADDERIDHAFLADDHARHAGLERATLAHSAPISFSLQATAPSACINNNKLPTRIE
jgi:hypothetical protein